MNGSEWQWMGDNFHNEMHIEWLSSLFESRFSCTLALIATIKLRMQHQKNYSTVLWLRSHVLLNNHSSAHTEMHNVILSIYYLVRSQSASFYQFSLLLLLVNAVTIRRVFSCVHLDMTLRKQKTTMNELVNPHKNTRKKLTNSVPSMLSMCSPPAHMHVCVRIAWAQLNEWYTYIHSLMKIQK